MGRKILTAFIVILLFILFIAIIREKGKFIGRSNGIRNNPVQNFRSPETNDGAKVKPSPNIFQATEDPCIEASSRDKAWCNEINAWLDKKLVDWKPAVEKTMMFTVVDWPLQSALAKSGNANLDDLFLDAMFELDPDTIYFSVFPQAYDAYKSRYDSAVQKIKSNNKLLAMSYNVGGDQDKDPTFSSTSTVDQYIQKENQYIDRYMVYNPDYFFVAVEPYTLNNRVKSKWTASDWKRIIQETSEHAKSINSKVKVGAIMTIADFKVFDAIKNLKSLDIIGFNLYGNRRMSEEYKDNTCSGDCVGEKLDALKSTGKEAWILETWSGPASETTFNKDWRAGIDSKWLKVIDYYAQKHGARNIMPFFTPKFITSGSPFPFQFNSLEKALKGGKRTEVFYSFKKLIDESK